MTVISIIDSALGAAENAAFCCGPNGVYVSGGLSVLQAAIDIFFGGQAQDDDAHRPINKQEVQDGIGQVLEAIKATALKSKLEGYTDDLASLQHGYATAVGAIKAGRGFDRSQNYLVTVDDQNWDDFYKQKMAVIADDQGTLNKAIADLNGEQDPATKYATTELYAGLVGMYMNYCHMLMLIEFNRDKLEYHKEHDGYEEWRKSYEAMVAKLPPGTPIPLEPPPPTRPPASFKKLVGSPWATSLRDELRENAPILEGRVIILEAYHADLVKKPTDRLAQVEVQADPAAGYYYVDHKTGSTSGRYPSRAAADMALQNL